MKTLLEFLTIPPLEKDEVEDRENKRGAEKLD